MIINRVLKKFTLRQFIPTQLTKTYLFQMIVLSVEGIIGAGKSTLIKIIIAKLEKMGKKVALITEPVKKWEECGILKLFYADPKRWAYHFQTKAFHDRIKENIEVYEQHRNQKVDVYIMERSPFTDNLFMDVLHDEGTITNLEYEHYREWWELWYKLMPYPIDAFLYVRPDVEVCLDRCKKRSRDGETGITKDYQNRLLEKHDAFLIKNLTSPLKEVVTTSLGTKCLIVNGNLDFKGSERIQNEIVEKLCSLLF